MAFHNGLRPKSRPGGARPLPPSPQPHIAELPPPQDIEPLHIRPKTPTRLQVPGFGSRPATPMRPVTPLRLKIPLKGGRSDPPPDSDDCLPPPHLSIPNISNMGDSEFETDYNRTVRPPVSSHDGSNDQLKELREQIDNFNLSDRRRELTTPEQTSDEDVPVNKPIREGFSGDDWGDDDFEDIGRLGEGAGGAVHKIRRINDNVVLARKTIPTRTTPAIQLIRELSFMSTNHINIIQFHGAYISPSSSEVKVLMELCEGGSLDAVGKRVREMGRRISEKVAGKLAEGIFSGLAYLHSMRIVHRDIKPSNILLSETGVVKLCDFGVSGELGDDSLADTFTGTGYYMAPERIQGKKYTIRSDVWSSGLTLLELAMNRFPYPDDLDNPIELMSFIVRGEIPQLQDEEDCTWSQEMKDFIKASLTVSDLDRPTPKTMLQHKWLTDGILVKPPNMSRWIREVWGWEEPIKKPKDKEPIKKPKSRPSSSRHREETPPWIEPVPVAAVN